METAPLTLAHTHARNAAQETKRSNAVAASEEHDLAAAEFAAAAQLTKDSEALRILNLLEQHHKRLGQVLKSRQNISIQDVPSETNADQDSSKTTPPPTADTGTRSTPSESTPHPPRLAKSVRPTGRDLSSSIVSNLASARGIPSNKQKRSMPVSPLVSNQHADGRLLQEDDNRNGSILNKTAVQAQTERDNGVAINRPSWTPPPDVMEASSKISKSDPTASDQPFQQFYSTFESLFSRLSAPLAFAGLPLSPSTTADSPKPQSPKTQPQTSPPAQSVDSTVNYSQLISSAALRAVSRNDRSIPQNPAESFYVVPPSGGTTSYAEIMTRADREASRHRRNTNNPGEDFVDAASFTLPSEPSTSIRRIGTDEKKVNGKTMEELSLENKALKHLSDTLSKRLHVFEMSAQTSSAALAQSIRSLHLSPLSTPENSRGKSNPTTAFSPESTTTTTNTPETIETTKLKSRLTELEEILRKSDARARKREDENIKLRDTLGKYREKWDSLKAGAKARREKAATNNAGTGTGTDTTREMGNNRPGEKPGTDTASGTERDEADASGDNAALETTST